VGIGVPGITAARFARRLGLDSNPVAAAHRQSRGLPRGPARCGVLDRRTRDVDRGCWLAGRTGATGQAAHRSWHQVSAARAQAAL